MTRQEMFDKAYLGLASQGFEQSTKGFGCAYRGDGGCKCAIGWLIPDEEYDVLFEGLSADATEIIHAAGIDIRNVGLALAIQEAHDGYSSNHYVLPMEMKERLAKVAYRYSLTIPQVPE